MAAFWVCIVLAGPVVRSFRGKSPVVPRSGWVPSGVALIVAVLRLPYEWILAALFFNQIILSRMPERMPPFGARGKLALRWTVAAGVSGFWVYLGFMSGSMTTLQDSKVVFGSKGSFESMPRAFATVTMTPHSGFADPKDADWRLSGHHGVRLSWVSNAVFWGPHGLTTGADLGRRMRNWAPVVPEPVNPKYAKYVALP
ncbi:MAG: hypothetical protein ACYC96_15570 [Fimbriimonadaceae bacterium]